MRTTFGNSLRAALAGAMLFACAWAHAGLTGKVVGIVDGDTLDVLISTGNEASPRPLRIRLAKIDAPEKSQPFGTRARETLAELVFGQTVDVELSGTDRWGRSIGTMRSHGTDVNRELVKRGMAWAFRRYLMGDLDLLKVEEDARRAQRGLWADPQAVAPWAWRAQRHESAKSDAAARRSYRDLPD